MTASRPPVAPGTVAVVGEALIDLTESGDDEPRLARPGGSPYNVAIGLARLGRPTAFLGRISRDPLGAVLRRHAERSGVDLSLAVDAHEPSTVALVELTDGIAEYRFGIDGTADFRWTEAELARLEGGFAAVHFGSLASWTPPGDDVIESRIARLEPGTLVTYDPNVRPHLQPDRSAARRRVERSVAHANLVKTSEEDVAWLYPGADVDEVVRGWFDLGPGVVVVTRGGDGSSAHTREADATRPVVPVEVVDTVGAGDAFMTGLLDALLDHRLTEPSSLARADADTLGALLDNAGTVAALTCAKAGSNPPRRAEVDAVLRK